MSHAKFRQHETIPQVRQPEGGQPEERKAVYSELAIDKRIENRTYRDNNIPNKESGLLSISIVPGDQFLGHLIIGPQFEARYDNGDPKRFNDCQTAQDEYLLESLDCLDKFLREISGDGVDWRVSIASHPCPGAAPPDIPLIKSVVERETTVQNAIQRVREARREAVASNDKSAAQSQVATSRIEIDLGRQP